ncbi:ribonucleoside-diphosphate reductase subunit alpha [Armatimonas rosea]|uniref:Ribonucleoside-diphosphate reductase n=1 Tax=Armatimonas rosea TaxID=685828 RepID=A0A7W9SLU5_ARMRO|nr:ribonucleoside-diphosphate reductase subunit alpha [Armatimonas rosea]MBB6049027.1 ribonucleoside-diphosphate reductase alpha chain [Armatimonas rosea]
MTINLPEILRDLEIKRAALLPEDEKPHFDGREAVHDLMGLPELEVQLVGKDQERTFAPEMAAQIVGDALVTFHFARGQQEVNTDENRVFVRDTTVRVVEKLSRLGENGRGARLSDYDLSVLVEAALIEKGAYEIAKALVMQRTTMPTSQNTIPAEQMRLIRRNGQVVPWNQDKIEVAVRKAFLSMKMESDAAPQITARVSERARGLGMTYIPIETVQDLVQEELVLGGYMKVAEDYILYRAKRMMLRASEVSQSNAPDPQFALIPVTEDDGTSNFWDGEDLRKRIQFASIGLDLCLSAGEIEAELRRSIRADIRREDLNKTIVLNAKMLMERDADFSFFAGRILLTYIYEETLTWDIVRDGIAGLKEAHKKAFKAYLDYGVQIERLSPNILSYDIDRLANALDPTADLDFDYLGLQTLYDRYLITDKTGKRPRRLEAPQFFWMRVAMGLFYADAQNKEEHALELYTMYKSRRFCSSTPTLFNSGTLHSQLSSCYLYKVDDSIESIMIRGIAENAFLSKWAGGLGGSWTAVRGTGSHIKGTNGESQGVIPFLKMHNDQLVAVNQGGKRAGSGCAYLEVWHNDIFDFLELRKNTGDERRRTHDMNTANWIPDLFMKRMEAREMWTLFRSSDVPDLHDLFGAAFEKRYAEYEKMADEGKINGRKVEAIELWKAMLKLIFETGHPWITFKDPCNVRSPQDHVGVIHSSNLCTEITLNTGPEETAVCNLGSVILDNHLTPSGEIDHVKLRETIQIAVRALDNVIDINYYPTKPAETSNKRHRPVGMGVMGLQYALYKKDIPFASQEAVEFNDEFMEAVAYYAYEASSDLAAERGSYSTFAGSKWDRGLLPADTVELLEKERGVEIKVARGGKLDWASLREKIKTQGMRNSNVLAIAPTATIANIMGTSPCIEPMYKNLFVKSNLSGDFVVLNSFLVKDLKAAGLWNTEIVDQIKYFDGDLHNIAEIPQAIKEKYLTAFQIPYEFLIDAGARRQKWIDQSQSLNLFLGTPDMKALSHMYRYAWHAGLKTTYYLRTLGASNIEKATVSLKMRETPAATEAPVKKVFTDAEKAACSIEAMRNGEECEACQ